MMHVLILHARPEVPDPVLFEGLAESVVLPGVQGEFEVMDFHKPIMSKLKEGNILVDNVKEFSIQGGIVKMSVQSVIALVET